MHRRILLLSLAALAVPGAAHAQTTTGGCTVGFRNGLLQFDPACSTLRLPGQAMGVSPPSHLVAPLDDGAVSTENLLHTERVAQLQKHRQKKRRKQNRKAGKHDNRHTQRARKRGKRNTRRAQMEGGSTPSTGTTTLGSSSSTSSAQNVACTDFATQDEAQTYFVSHGYSATNDPFTLDGNNNGLACEDLPTDDANEPVDD